MEEKKEEIIKDDKKITVRKIFKHLHTVNKHRRIVRRLCFKAGEYYLGLTHDLSKYSPEEFFESVKYYTGKRSPISRCKEDKGYSRAWLHHSGRNKHHFEYWYEYLSPDATPVIPYKYTVEMICDNLSAGITYMGRDWTKEYQFNYFKTHDESRDLRMNQKNKDILYEVFELVAKEGINPVINKKRLKEIYIKHVGEII